MSESNRLLNFATSSELIANGEGRNVLSAIEAVDAIYKRL